MGKTARLSAPMEKNHYGSSQLLSQHCLLLLSECKYKDTLTSQSPHSFLHFPPDLTTHRTHAGLSSLFLIFPTTPQKTQHNAEFSKCCITQLHKITSENTNTGDFKTQKWNCSPIQQENRSLKVNQVRT